MKSRYQSAARSLLLDPRRRCRGPPSKRPPDLGELGGHVKPIMHPSPKGTRTTPLGPTQQTGPVWRLHTGVSDAARPQYHRHLPDSTRTQMAGTGDPDPRR